MLRVLRELLGYVLGLALFVGLIPLLMWLVAGRPALCSETTAWQWIIGTILIVAGLALSIWTIIHWKQNDNLSKYIAVAFLILVGLSLLGI